MPASTQLLEIKSKQAALAMARQCLTAERISTLIARLRHPKAGPKAAWVLSHAFDQQPELGRPHQEELVRILETTPHSAVARAILRYLEQVSIAKSLYRQLCEIALDYLEDPAQPVAPKAFAMAVALKCAGPQQKKMLVEIVKKQLAESTYGFKVRASNLLGLVQ